METSIAPPAVSFTIPTLVVTGGCEGTASGRVFGTSVALLEFSFAGLALVVIGGRGGATPGCAIETSFVAPAVSFPTAALVATGGCEGATLGWPFGPSLALPEFSFTGWALVVTGGCGGATVGEISLTAPASSFTRAALVLLGGCEGAASGRVLRASAGSIGSFFAAPEPVTNGRCEGATAGWSTETSGACPALVATGACRGSVAPRAASPAVPAVVTKRDCAGASGIFASDGPDRRTGSSLGRMAVASWLSAFSDSTSVDDAARSGAAGTLDQSAGVATFAASKGNAVCGAGAVASVCARSSGAASSDAGKRSGFLPFAAAPPPRIRESGASPRGPAAFSVGASAATLSTRSPNRSGKFGVSAVPRAALGGVTVRDNIGTDAAIGNAAGATPLTVGASADDGPKPGASLFNAIARVPGAKISPRLRRAASSWRAGNQPPAHNPDIYT
jgi:hypothetical protein